MKKTPPKPTTMPVPTSLGLGLSGVAPDVRKDGIPAADAANIPSILGGESKMVFVPRPVLRRVAFLQKTTPDKVIETLKILHGVEVTICDWPTGEPFFLVAGVDRNFPEDKQAACCNCHTALLISGDAPENAVPICVRCVRYQAILASTHGVTFH